MSKSQVTPVVLFGVTIDYQLRYHHGLYESLAERGWDVHLVSSPGASLETAYVDQHVSAHAILMERSPRPIKDLASLGQWIVLLSRVRPNVVVIGTPKASLLGMIAAVLARVPIRIYELHGLRLETLSGFSKWMMVLLERFTCYLATDVIAVGRSLAVSAVRERVVHRERIRVLGAGSPNGVASRHFERAPCDERRTEQLARELGLDTKLPIIVFVGRLTEEKGLSTLAAALDRLIARVPCQLLVVGSIDDLSGHAGLELLRNATHVVSTGFVEDVAPYLRIASVLCLPSLREGLPTVILEAFAARIPVVATAVTGSIDVVEDRVTGRLVPVNDPDALALALEDVLLSPALVQELTRNASVFVRSHFEQAKVQQRWVDFIEDLINGKGHRNE